MTWNGTQASGTCIDHEEWNTMVKYIQTGHYSGANSWNSHNYSNSSLVWDDSIKKFKAMKSGGGTGGSSTFLGLTDTPNSYPVTGPSKSGQIAMVNIAGDALEFRQIVCTATDVLVQGGNVIFI